MCTLNSWKYLAVSVYEEGPLNLNEFKNWCKQDLSEIGSCAKFQCGPHSKKTKRCNAPPSKVECGLAPNPGYCTMIGCTVKDGRCKGKPFKKKNN